ncbi:MAG: IS5 family transposase [Dokdonella sp.]
MPTIDAASRHDLSDVQWAILEPLLPPPASRGRPRRWSLRGLIDGVRHRVRTGEPWRDVPSGYGPWWRVYALFRTWQIMGVWQRIEQALLAEADRRGKLDWRAFSVDSTSIRAHVHATGARRDSVKRVAGEPEHHALGRSRGGWGTKVHLACEQGRGVVSMLLTPGQAGDPPQMIPVLNQIQVPRPGNRGRPRQRPERVLADAAYSSRANRSWLAERHIRATIPIKADQARHRAARGSRGGRPPVFDTNAYRDRHAIECAINANKQYRAFATRYDKLAVRYDAVTRIVNISRWLRRLS